MNGQQREPGAGDQRDPIADFFARERSEVRDLPGAPDHWESVVEQARRPRRRSRLPYLAVAAAAVVVGGLVWGTGYGPSVDRAVEGTAHPSSRTSTSPPVSGTRTPTPTVTAPDRSAPASSSPPPTSTVAGGPLPVPASFAVVSMTNGGGGHLRALGAATCAGGKPCVSVVGSDDDGSTWTARSTFTGESAAGMARRTPDADNQLTGLRFATPDIGYAFGSKAFRSVDAGRHFKPFDVGGRRVLSLEVGGGTVWLVTATECRHGAPADGRGCAGLEVWSAPTSATKATRVRAIPTPQPAEAAWLSMDGADAYVSVSYADPSVQTPPMRVSGTPVALPVPSGCARSGGVWVWGTANTRRGLVLLCRAAAAPGKAYAVATSRDSGATWSTPAPATSLGAPSPAGVWLTAVDLDRLVAVVHGLPTSDSLPGQPTALLSSADGGAGWVAPRTAKGSGGWSWAGAGGGDLVYGLGGAALAYDVSTDAGASFGQRSFRS